MRHAVALSLLLLVASSVSAATFEVPTDVQLLGHAEVVVVARVEGSAVRETADRSIFTDYRLVIEETLKGSARGTIVVSELGGYINGRGLLVPGSATYKTGARVLAFLRRYDDGTYQTAFMALGQYRFAERDGIEVLVRDADGIESLAGSTFDMRPARKFVDAIRSGAPGDAPHLEASPSERFQPRGEGNPADYVFTHTDGTPIRWNCPSSCDIEFTVNQVHPVVDTLGGLQDAYDAWTNDANSWVNLDTNGVGADTGRTNDDENDIVFDWDGSNSHAACEGSKGCGLIYYNGPSDDHMFRGVYFFDVIAADVLIHQSVTSQTAFETILAHELGHALAIDHGPAGSLMAPSVPTNGGAVLKAWDKEAMAEVYGNGLPCVNVVITNTNGGGNVPYGEKKTLTVQASGTTPLTYQWYEGISGDTTKPVGTGSTFQTPNITEEKKYWVKVSNNCPSSANSVTLTVTPLPCTAPDITTQPESKRINPGQTATLSVQATGTATLKYQWYRGNVGDTSNPVGSNQNTFTTPVLNNTTSYWVKVANNCGFENSALATITVSATCVPPSVTSQPGTVNVGVNETAPLSVSAAGDTPFSYQWYNGDSGNAGSPIAGATSATYVAGPFATPGTHKYWLKINNACGQTATTTITVVVSGGCIPVTISAQPSTVDVGVGEGASLGVGVAGTGPFTYQWYAGESGDPSNPIAGATNATYAAGPFNTPGTFKFWVKINNNCGQVGSATISVLVACPLLEVPDIFAPPLSPHSSSYEVSWTGDHAVSTFELQEATNPGFTANLVTYPVNGSLQQTIPAHDTITTDTRFYYRVRALSVCTGQPTLYSPTVSTVVTRPLPANSSKFAVTIPEGVNQPYVQDYLVPGFGAEASNGDTFSISIDVPWMTVFPASGALSAGGTTVQLTIDPTGLEIGSTTATLTVTRTQGSGKVGTHDGATTSSVPFNVSLVTPVTPSTREGSAPPGTMIIPAVAHAQGIGSPFSSDVRIANVSFNDITYEISFTPSGSGGWASNKMTTVTVRSGDTLAFNDIVYAWYGSGLLGESGSGTIEIRPLEGADPLATFASSRTYALVGNGTLGQFIPALLQDQFITNTPGNSLSKISLQQIANSAAYRTNVGFVEGSGGPVEVLAKLIDGNNNILQTKQFQLGPFEHLQNSLGGLFNNTNLEDGRVEVEALSPSGKVTAYASVVNNATNDPFLVFPEQAARQTAERYTLPGIAEFVAPDGRNFHSDMRLYNAGAAPVTVTLEYYERGQSTPRADAPVIQRTLNAGQVLSANDVLPNLFNLTAGGGSVVAKAPAGSSLVLTAQTYSRQPDGGTKGQFIPGVTAADGVGFGDRAVQVLQAEQSAQYRTNLGLVELTGNDIVVEVTAYEADTKFSASTSVPLKANEYRQLDRILESMGLGTVYNGQISVKVLTGNGRVAAYGSTIDNLTEDPTYVPSQ